MGLASAHEVQREPGRAPGDFPPTQIHFTLSHFHAYRAILTEHRCRGDPHRLIKGNGSIGPQDAASPTCQAGENGHGSDTGLVTMQGILQGGWGGAIAVLFALLASPPPAACFA